MAKLEETGLTPADHAFYPAARQSVVDLGIVRRRKIEVAADIPARRIADLAVELEGAEGRSIREAERKLAERLVARYEAALATEERRASSPRASTTIWYDESPLGALEGRQRVVLGGEETSSPWSAGSAGPRRRWPPTTPHSWPAAPARWCSSPSTST